MTEALSPVVTKNGGRLFTTPQHANNKGEASASNIAREKFFFGVKYPNVTIFSLDA